MNESRLGFGLTRAGSRIHRISGSDPRRSACGRDLEFFFGTRTWVAAPNCKLCFKPDGTAA